jgi:hypothetical protein
VCRNEKIYNRGQKQILVLNECEVIEAVEDTNFGFISSSHFKVTKTINIANGFKYVIQRNIKDFDIGTYIIAQKKMLLSVYLDT